MLFDARGGVDLDASANTISINVMSVNDAPAGADRTVTMLEDTGYVFSAGVFGFSDTADSPSNNLSAVKITAMEVRSIANACFSATSNPIMNTTYLASRQIV